MNLTYNLMRGLQLTKLCNGAPAAAWTGRPAVKPAAASRGRARSATLYFPITHRFGRINAPSR